MLTTKVRLAVRAEIGRWANGMTAVRAMSGQFGQFSDRQRFSRALTNSPLIGDNQFGFRRDDEHQPPEQDQSQTSRAGLALGDARWLPALAREPLSVALIFGRAPVNPDHRFEWLRHLVLLVPDNRSTRRILPHGGRA